MVIKPRIFTALCLILLVFFSLNVIADRANNRNDYVKGEYIVKFKSNQNIDAGIREMHSNHNIISAKSLSVDVKETILSSNQKLKIRMDSIKRQGLDRIYLVSVPKLLDEQKFLRELKSDPSVEYAELNYIVSIDAIPNDPSFSNLYGLHNTGQNIGTPDADIDAPEAWDTNTGNSNVIVAVIDTGVDYTHEDLAANMWTNPNEVVNGIDDDENGFVDDVKGWDFINHDNNPMDDNGHGTHVSGTIGAVGNNGKGVVGVNWQVKIMPLKFGSANGFGTNADAISAIQYAILMGADIMSNSWGSKFFEQSLKDAIIAANNAGVLFVAAAGNDDTDNDVNAFYPANYDVPNVIAVAATDYNDAKAGFSNYGANTVHIGAPGVNIYSTIPNGYGYKSGTSMATPHVAGAAALLLSSNPSLSHLDLKNKILIASDPIPSMQGKTISGGRLNVFNFFESDAIPPAPINDIQVLSKDAVSATLQWTAVGDDGLAGKSARYIVHYSTSLINDANFDSAANFKNTLIPKPSGSIESLTVNGLEPATTYYIAIKSLDNVGNPSAISNVVSALTSPVFTVFSDDMENGVNGWTVDGTDGKGGAALWHQSTRRSLSPTHSWYYGIESTGNYNTGFRNFGSITKANIDLRNIVGSTLQFQHFLATEVFSPFDIGSIRVSTDGVAWTTLLSSFSTNGVWAKETLNLANYDGQIISIRFFFDTVDDFANNFEGWYVDDVKVFGALTNITNQTNQTLKPIANSNGPYSGLVNELITFNGSASFDPSNNPLTYTWSFGDGASLISINPFVQHAYSNAGIYQVILVVNNSITISEPSITSANISKPNTAPVANDSNVSTQEDTPIPINLIASDEDNDPLTFTILTQPIHGTLSGVAPSLVYAPAKDFNGKDSFTFKANDGKVDSNIATVNIDVAPVNDAPVANAGPDKTSNVNQIVSFDGTASFDIDSLIVSYLWVFGDGSSATGAVVSHSYAVSGKYNVTLTVSDGLLRSNDTALVTVNPPISKPDLIVSAVSTSQTSVGRGKFLYILNTVKNIGNAVSNSFYVNFHLSLDQTYGGTDDVNLPSIRSAPTLKPGVNSTANTREKIPSSMPTGVYYICAFADSKLKVNELDESNNALCSTKTITIK